jgi:SAM-dependent methyltransferase
MTVLTHRLQLGAFDQAPDGWVNTDITPHLFIARVPGLAWVLHRVGVIGPERYASHRAGVFRSVRYLDVSKRFRFPDGSFECVYASHMLEHLDPEVAERCLREVHRVLGPGGILRLAVPDLDGVIAGYDRADPDTFLDGLFEGHSDRRSSASRHRWQYNAVSLKALMERVGFRDVQRCDYREGRCPDLDEVETRQWSLFMEGVK